MLEVKPKLLANCQTKPPILLPKGPPPGTRVEHKVQNDETFDSVARKYGCP